MNNNYITISELSKITNIPKSKLYRIIDKYKDYIKNENGIKYINRCIIPNLTENNTDNSASSQSVKQGKSAQVNTNNIIETSIVSSLETLVKQQNNIISNQQEIINSKDKEIDALKEKLQDYENKLFECLKHEQEISANALELQKQMNYLTASRELKKKQGFFKRLLGKNKDTEI